jgi:hypothetical protein
LPSLIYDAAPYAIGSLKSAVSKLFGDPSVGIVQMKATTAQDILSFGGAAGIPAPRVSFTSATDLGTIRNILESDPTQAIEMAGAQLAWINADITNNTNLSPTDRQLQYILTTGYNAGLGDGGVIDLIRSSGSANELVRSINSTHSSFSPNPVRYWGYVGTVYDDYFGP